MFEGLFQPTHLILILLVAFIVFGPSRLPQIGAGLGKSIRDFKKAIADPIEDAPVAASTRQLEAPCGIPTIPSANPTETNQG